MNLNWYTFSIIPDGDFVFIRVYINYYYLPVLTRNEVTNGVVHRIHYLMGVLLLLKCLSLLFESIRYHYISIGILLLLILELQAY